MQRDMAVWTFARWLAAAGLAAGSVALTEGIAGKRAAWTLTVIIAGAVMINQDPKNEKLVALINSVFGEQK